MYKLKIISSTVRPGRKGPVIAEWITGIARATFKIVPLYEAVNIPFFNEHINESGVFVPGEKAVKAANVLLKELERWTKGLLTIKADV